MHDEDRRTQVPSRWLLLPRRAAAITFKQRGDLARRAVLHQRRKLEVAAAAFHNEKAETLRKKGIPSEVEEIVVGADAAD